MTFPHLHPFTAAAQRLSYSVVTRGADQAPFAEVFDTLDEAATNYAECMDNDIAVTVFRGDEDVTATCKVTVREWLEAQGYEPHEMPEWLGGEVDSDERAQQGYDAAKYGERL